MIFEPKLHTTEQLLQIYGQILEELRERKVVRSSNSPVGDYAEWLVANQLGLTLVANSTSGYDAFDSFGQKVQIKGRMLTKHNKSKQLSAIRNLQNHDFDYLVTVFFNEKLEVEQVLKIPYEIIVKYAQYRKHVNAHILIIRDNILGDPMLEHLTPQFRGLDHA